MLTNHLNLRRQLDNIQAELTAPLPEPRNRLEARQSLTTAQTQVRDLNKQAATLCMSYLEEQA